VNKAEDDLTGARTLAARPKPLKDIVCFHCQQAAEKYLKALLHELGITVLKTHDLDTLVTLLLPHEPWLKSLGRRLDSLTTFAVDYRYPILRASAKQMKAGLATAELLRAEVRKRLGLRP
jgi:HEPN domain-containing protein